VLNAGRLIESGRLPVLCCADLFGGSGLGVGQDIESTIFLSRTQRRFNFFSQPRASSTAFARAVFFFRKQSRISSAESGNTIKAIAAIQSRTSFIRGSLFLPNVCSQTRRGAVPSLSVVLWIGFFLDSMYSLSASRASRRLFLSCFGSWVNGIARRPAM